MGRSHARPAALLNPEVFQEFVIKNASGRSILGNLDSELLQLLSETQKPRAARAGFAQDRKLRVLLVSNDNWHFVRPAVGYFEQHGLEVRYLSFSQCRDAIVAQRKKDSSKPSLNEMMFGLGAYQVSVEEANEAFTQAAPWARDLIDWCDVVFVEWWNAPAIWFSRYLSPEKSLVIRCHSYEAFSPVTHFTNMRRVDGAVFIADHIRQIFNAVYSDLPVSEQTQVVISNIRSRDHLLKVEKQGDVSFTLGMMQYANINKDPLFALDILEKLVLTDDRWTLNLIGNGWDETESDEERKVSRLSRHVVIEPFTKDTAAWHKRIGFVLSASHREGSHESVMDGMVTGSVPVIRRWPMVKDFGAPESAFPGVPAFDTPQEAADYILKSRNSFDEMSRHSRKLALAIYDPKIAGAELATFVTECARQGLDP